MTSSSEKMTQYIYDINKLVGTYDPFAIADYFNIEYRYIDASSKFYGESACILGSPLLLINSRYRFSNHKFVIMAHELFHALEHPGLTSYYTLGGSQKYKLEYEANSFTAGLLLGLYEEITGYPPKYYCDLQNEFGIGYEFEEFYFKGEL